MSDLIEDETPDSYTIRTDKLQEGESVQCRDDRDMSVKIEKGSVLLIKKCFRNDCFSKAP